MQEVVLVIHLILTISLVVLVLIQRSSGGGLGMGGSGQGGMMAGRGSATLLTRITTYLAVGFFVTSLGLAVIAKQQTADSSIFDVEDKAIEQTEPEIVPAEDKPEPVIPDSE